MPDSPYKGLMPYAEEDAPFFFGRDAEREIITANLMASRLTLLYGASGVGKSSVLCAGVAHHLRELGQQNLAERGTPEFAVVVFSAWRDDPIAGLMSRIQESVTQALNSQTVDPVSPSRALAQTLQAWTERVDGDLLIILDQFEEYFLYHAQEDGEGTFAVEFPHAVNRPDLRVSFLLSIREDALAKLDRFKGRVPNLFDNYLRIEHLDREAARAAIEEPLKQYNRLQAVDGQQVSVEPALVEAVLEQVRTGHVVLGEAGLGVAGDSTNSFSPEMQVETPYLQLVLTRLWKEEIDAGSHVLRRETLNRLGGAERIVRMHLDNVMSGLPQDAQDNAAHVFHYLVTPGGMKIAHTVSDLDEYTGLAQQQVESVLEQLSHQEIRILRPIRPPDQQAPLRYEIFHDVLAPAILDWRARYIQEQERREAERRAEEQQRIERKRREQAEREAEKRSVEARRLRNLVVMLIIACLLAVGAGVYAWTQRQLAMTRAIEVEVVLEEVEKARAAEDAVRAAQKEAEVAREEAEKQTIRAETAIKEAASAREKASTESERARKQTQLAAVRGGEVEKARAAENAARAAQKEAEGAREKAELQTLALKAAQKGVEQATARVADAEKARAAAVTTQVGIFVGETVELTDHAAEILRQSATNWERLAWGTKIALGDRLRTPTAFSRVGVRLDNGGLFTLGGNVEVLVKEQLGNGTIVLVRSLKDSGQLIYIDSFGKSVITSTGQAVLTR